MLLAICILGALYEQKSTGKGQRLQIAMQDAMLHYIRLAFATQARKGGPIKRVGDQSVSGGNPPCGIYPCKGGGPNDYVYVYTSRANPEHWKRLLQVLGREDLLADPRFATPQTRAEHEAEIIALVTSWTKKHDKHKAMRLLGSAGIPAGAVLDTKELDEDKTFYERGILQAMEHPDGQGLRHSGLAGAAQRRAAGGQGLAAAGRAFRRGAESWLGLGEREIEGLAAGQGHHAADRCQMIGGQRAARTSLQA